MSFNGREMSRAAGRPFHLYRFKIGPAAGDVLCYTNVAEPITYAGDTYLPLAITHGDVVSSGNLDKSTLTVSSPDESDLAALFKQQPPSYVMTLIIRQGHLGDPEYAVVWSGRVLNGTFNGNTLENECEPVVSSLRRPGLTRDYQLGCPLVLYGPQCRANKAAATYVSTVSAVDGPLVTLPDGWAPEGLREKFVGGYASWTNTAGRTEIRSIVYRSGNDLQLGSFGDLQVGDAITLVLGCNHLMDDCKNVHNNILNYGGQPEIPLVNPIGIINNYY